MGDEQILSSEGDEYIDEDGESPIPKKAPANPGKGGNALFWVAIFIVIFFAAAAMYVGYVHSILGGDSATKAKKLSKKKVLIL